MKTIYLIFDEITIPVSSHVGQIVVNYINSADIKDFPICAQLKIGVPFTEDIILPAFITTDPDPLNPILIKSPGLSRLDIFNSVQEHFQIFKDLRFEIANNFPLNPWNVQNAGYLKIHNTYEEMTLFNLTDDKWKPAKRFICNGRGKILGFVIGDTGIGFSVANPDAIIHEAGHLLGLDHIGYHRYARETSPRGRRRETFELVGPNSDNWVPIMGHSHLGGVFSWSNGDYIDAARSGPEEFSNNGVIENDVKKIIETNPVKLIKNPPKDYVWTTKYNNPNSSKNRSRKTRKTLRVLKKTDGTNLGGMLGYPFDFDLYAILVRPGEFTAKAVPEYPEATSCSLEILACDCLLDFKKYRILENWIEQDFGGIYRERAIKDDNWTPLVNGGTLSLAYVEHNSREESKYIYQRNMQEFGLFESPYTGFSSITMHETSLIILKVSGGYKNVDRNTKQPNVINKGISQYGALGKYTLKLSKPSESNSGIIGRQDSARGTLSIGSCETYTSCSQSFSLFSDYDVLLPDPKGIHTLDLEVITNGRVQTKSFLVYGEPKNRRDRLPEHGVFLDVIIDGECKKQEFVVGLRNPDFL